VRLFLGPVTFAFSARQDNGNIAEAFNQHIKLHKRRASFIDLQRSSSPLYFLAGAKINIREVSARIPARSSQRTILPACFSPAQPLAVPLPRRGATSTVAFQKEILLI
jgi:hypothetical protein